MEPTATTTTWNARKLRHMFDFDAMTIFAAVAMANAILVAGMIAAL